MKSYWPGRHPRAIRPGALAAFLLLGCLAASSACDFRPRLLASDTPLHLEDHVSAAIVTGSELPANPPQAVEWRFDQPQPDWKATPLWNPPFGASTLARTGDGLRVTLTDRTRVADGRLRGGIHVAVPEWDRRDWADLVRHYTGVLQRQWEAHQPLARRFSTGGSIELTAAQLETLRALGYIR